MTPAKRLGIRRSKVPIYKPRRGRPPGPLAREIMGLEVGGCLLIDDMRRYDLAKPIVSIWAKKLGFKLKTAKHPEGQGFGIWRLA